MASSFDDQQIVSASSLNSSNISNTDSYFCTQSCALLFPFANLTNSEFNLFISNDVTHCNSLCNNNNYLSLLQLSNLISNKKKRNSLFVLQLNTRSLPKNFVKIEE